MVTVRQPAGRARGEAGFTLIELLLALVVSLCVVGAATLLAGQMQTSYRNQFEGATAQQEGRYAVQWIEGYLRSAGNNPYRLGTTPCPATGTPVLAFRLDPDGNGVQNDVRVQMDAAPVNGLIGGPSGACTEANEDVTIAGNPTTRLITVTDNNTGGGAQARTDNVIESLRFVYRSPNRVVTTSEANIAFVETTVTVRTRVNDPNTGQPRVYTIRSEIRVRNR